MGLRLAPSGRLIFDSGGNADAPGGPSPLETAFRDDWRAALFSLAAGKELMAAMPDVRYWQRFAQRYLTVLCHVPEEDDRFEVEAPTAAELAEAMLTAPPMTGGEYLSEATLRHVWSSIDDWVREAIAETGGLPAFLAKQAPKWHQVGRVCFHLAENRTSETQPFAFMATFATGFGATGRLKHLPLRKALEQYAGNRNRKALVNLLMPVRRAAETCQWVGEMVESGEIYSASAWLPERAYRMLRSVPDLEESGLSVRVPNWWRARARPQVTVEIGGNARSSVNVSTMLQLDVGVALDGEALSEEELQALLTSDASLMRIGNQWVEVDRERLQQALDHWRAIQRDAGASGVSFLEGMRLLAGASPGLLQEDQSEAEREWVQFKAGDALSALLTGLRDPKALDAVQIDGALRATLRPYQRDGLNWLHFVTGLGLGACLADDMGLGKTIQVLALLLCIRQDAAAGEALPSLLVIPASLLGNWRAEAARFAPSLRLCFLHPSEIDRTKLEEIAAAPREGLVGHDLVITTYGMLTRQTWLHDQPWRLVVLDEAQAIKNPGTRQSRTVRKLQAGSRVVLTGTPVENNLGDLWALFDFLNPGLLGSLKVFQNFVKALQSRENNPFAPLRRLISPYILRRMKTDRNIISDLPDKTEIQRFCGLTRIQVAQYSRVVEAMKSELETGNAMARRGLVLRSLMQLKQICNHPGQFLGNQDYPPQDSGKFQRLAEICGELAERQERVLVFTQFREIIDPMAEYLETIFGRSGLVLHGAVSVPKRRNLVERFDEEDGPPFFILSLRAGGTGLNLTAASHVIHFDRWWNPAVENQATDRAFRIGQKRNVLVHKFVVRGTIEEAIDRMIADKQDLADEILLGADGMRLTELSDADLLDLVRLDVNRATL